MQLLWEQNGIHAAAMRVEPHVCGFCKEITATQKNSKIKNVKKQGGLLKMCVHTGSSVKLNGGHFFSKQ